MPLSKKQGIRNIWITISVKTHLNLKIKAQRAIAWLNVFKGLLNSKYLKHNEDIWRENSYSIYPSLPLSRAVKLSAVSPQGYS